MSYFAVLSEEPSALEVARCHINLWVLPGLFGRNVFHLDVGLGLTRKTEATRAVRLALPVGVDEGDVEDLRAKTEANANLIFGEPALVEDHTLRLGEASRSQSIKLSGLKIEKDTKSSGRDYSVWSLTPQNWSKDGETYIRCRFRVSSFRTGWLSQKSGALVDLRICDVRESVRTLNQSGLDDQIVPIRELNLFTILPTSLKCRAVSPAPRHVRMLEGEAWSDYLHRSRSSLSARKLTVYYWRSKAEPDAAALIGKRSPFRAFLDLTEEQAVLGWKPYLVVILTAGVVAYGKEFASQILSLLQNLWAWVAAIGVASIVKYGGTVVSLLRNVPTVRTLVRRVEDWRYGPS